MPINLNDAKAPESGSFLFFYFPEREKDHKIPSTICKWRVHVNSCLRLSISIVLNLLPVILKVMCLYKHFFFKLLVTIHICCVHVCNV